MSDRTQAMPAPAEGAPCLEVRNLKMYFGHTGGFFKQKTGTVKAVDGVDLTVHDGETVGLVGESGCGKSTLGRAILRVYEPTEGSIRYRRRGTSEWIDLTGASPDTLTDLRHDIRMIFQDPFTSLNPRMTLLDLVGEPLYVHGMRSRRAREERRHPGRQDHPEG